MAHSTTPPPLRCTVLYMSPTLPYSGSASGPGWSRAPCHRCCRSVLAANRSQNIEPGAVLTLYQSYGTCRTCCATRYGSVPVYQSLYSPFTGREEEDARPARPPCVPNLSPVLPPWSPSLSCNISQCTSSQLRIQVSPMLDR